MPEAGAHIALFVGSLAGGGAERNMLIVAEALAARGHRVDVVVAGSAGPRDAAVGERVRKVELRARSVLASLPRLARWLRRERPAAVLATLPNANVVAVLARALARVETRVVLREANTISLSLLASSRLQDRALARLVRLAYPRADAVVAVSHGVAEDLVRSGVRTRRIVVVHNPTATPDLAARADQPLDDAWLQPGSPPVIVAAGRLAPQKDFATLLRAFALVRQQREVRLLVLGEGDLRAELVALVRTLGVAGDVRFHGQVPDPLPYFGRASLFALSSRFEGFPNVLVQAMAAGAPVVATDCPSGPHEILHGGKLAPLVPVGNAAALADAMLATLNERPDTARLRQRAGDFGPDNAVRAYEEVLLA